jgi:hypothetical protein
LLSLDPPVLMAWPFDRAFLNSWCPRGLGVRA